MKKTIIGIAVALSLSGVAFAGDYGDAVARQKMCDTYGNLAVTYYKQFQKSNDRMTQSYKFTEMALNKQKEAREAQKAGNSAKVDRLIVTASVLHYTTEANSEKDARMHAWGECMDMPDRE